MVVLPTGWVPAMITEPGFPTTTAGIVSGVVVVVVVVTERVGTGGGGEKTKCESGPVWQPVRIPSRPQQTKTGVNLLIARAELEEDRNVRILIFIK